MVEAPPDLQALLIAQATANGMEIVRDEPVELRCSSEQYPDATFLIYWPEGNGPMHMRVPIFVPANRAHCIPHADEPRFAVPGRESNFERAATWK